MHSDPFERSGGSTCIGLSLGPDSPEQKDAQLALTRRLSLRTIRTSACPNGRWQMSARYRVDATQERLGQEHALSALG